MATKTLFVGNLSYSTTESELVKNFSAYGGSNARIIEGRGFGFVDIDSDKLDTAIAEKNNTEMDGRTVNVNEARPKGDGGSGSLGRGYGGGGSRGSSW